MRTLRLKAEKAADELEIETSGVVMGVPVQYGDIQKNVLKQAMVKQDFMSRLKRQTAKRNLFQNRLQLRYIMA